MIPVPVQVHRWMVDPPNATTVPATDGCDVIFTQATTRSGIRKRFYYRFAPFAGVPG